MEPRRPGVDLLRTWAGAQGPTRGEELVDVRELAPRRSSTRSLWRGTCSAARRCGSRGNSCPIPKARTASPLKSESRPKFRSIACVQPVGVSRDSPWTHIAWTQAIDLNFGLLSDFNGDAVRAFGIGQEFRGFRDVARRCTFLAGEDGIVAAAWSYENSELPDIDELLAACRALRAGPSPESSTPGRRGSSESVWLRTGGVFSSSSPASDCCFTHPHEPFTASARLGD